MKKIMEMALCHTEQGLCMMFCALILAGTFLAIIGALWAPLLRH